MLINFSNHPTSEWQQTQIDAANRLYGGVIDIPFPDVDPIAPLPAVESLADSCMRNLMPLIQDNDVVHIMGEMTLTYILVNRLKQSGIKCVASCSERACYPLGDNEIAKTFIFKQFRSYF